MDTHRRMVWIKLHLSTALHVSLFYVSYIILFFFFAWIYIDSKCSTVTNDMLTSSNTTKIKTVLQKYNNNTVIQQLIHLNIHKVTKGKKTTVFK